MSVLRLIAVSVLIVIGSVGCGQTEFIGVKIQGLGYVVGVVDQSRWTKKPFYSFTGIHFAESPTGNLRFKAPVPVQPWAGELDTTKPGRLCPQDDVFTSNDTEGDIEDCLHLSVYTPTLVRGNLPVMVYIHGGGWYEGGAERHPPHYYMEEDIVLVVPQYRLGPLGFLSLETEDIPGNAGFLDTILSLKWIQNHVSNFGGDPNQVTVVGQSAGAACISLLLQSPLLDASLFSRAIMQSGGSLGTWVLDNNPVENAMQIANFANCTFNGATETEITGCLKRISPKDLFHAYDSYKSLNKKLGSDKLGGDRATVGGPTGFLSMTPLDALRSGNFRKIPMMAGVTEQEGSFVVGSSYEYLKLLSNDESVSNVMIIEVLLQMLGMAEVDVTGSIIGLSQYGLFSPTILEHGNLTDIIPGLIDLIGLFGLKGPVFREIQIRARGNPNNSYLYSFDYSGEHTRFGYGEDLSHLPFSGGVSHSNDNIYLFPWPESVAELNEEDAIMSRTMVKLWTSFVKTGKPTARSTPVWKPVTNLLGPYMKINKVSRLGSNFLEEFSAATKNMRSSSTSNSVSFVAVFLISFISILLK